jgi:hypothetical protein
MFYLSILFLSILSQSSFGITCSKIPMLIKLSKDIVYTYNNSISIATWPEGIEVKENIKRQKDSFKTFLYPSNLDSSSGYTITEINMGSSNRFLLDLLGKERNKLPVKSHNLFYPVGFKKNSKSHSAQILKSVRCNEVYKTLEEVHLDNLHVYMQKESIHKITDIKRITINKIKTPVLHIETRSKVYLKGRMEGTGSEITKTLLIADTRELYSRERNFRYTYDIGRGISRHREVMTGQHLEKLVNKTRKKEKKQFFLADSSKLKTTHYFSNSYGIFIPVTINTNLKTQLHISTTQPTSFIHYDFYNAEFSSTDQDLFYPVDKLKIGNNYILNPEFSIFKKEDLLLKFDSKVPGLIGNNILKLGALYINDKKRSLSFYEPLRQEIPENAVIFKLIDNVPVFNSIINGQQVDTTISLDSYEHYISYKLKKMRDLKSRKIALSKKNPESNVLEKAWVILTPPKGNYFKTEVIIEDFNNAPYDLKLGINYFKNKTLIIDYKNKWLLIK